MFRILNYISVLYEVHKHTHIIYRKHGNVKNKLHYVIICCITCHVFNEVQTVICLIGSYCLKIPFLIQCMNLFKINNLDLQI